MSEFNPEEDDGFVEYEQPDDPRDAADRAGIEENVRELLLRDAPRSELDLVADLDPVDLAAAIRGLSHSLRRLVRTGPTVWRADGSVSLSTDGNARVVPRESIVSEVRQYLSDGADERTIEKSDSVVTWIEQLAHRRPHVLAFVAAAPVEGGLLLTRVDAGSHRPDADRWADLRPVTAASAKGPASLAGGTRALHGAARRATWSAPPTAAKDWIDGSKAVSWGRWNPKWPVSLMADIQHWGDDHCIRFILVSEYNDKTTAKITAKDYYLVLYAAPKPNRRETGLCVHSISNRDQNLPSFSAWFEGFRAGRGIYDV